MILHRRTVRLALAALFLAIVSPIAAPVPFETLSPALQKGRANAQRYCAACHLMPEPEALTKSAWVHHVQPEMAKWLGLEAVDFEGMPDGRLIEETGIFPKTPLLSEEEWFSIWDYYRAAAPSKPAPPPAKPALQPALKQFRVRKLNPHDSAPMTSMVRIDTARKQIYFGDAFAGMLFAIEPNGTVASRLRMASAPVSLAIGDDGLYVTRVGRFFPSDALEGAVEFLPKEGSTAPARVLTSNLRRPVHTALAHLNTDTRLDLVVCSFGNRLGRLSWFEGLEDGKFTERVLLERPGSIQAEVRDFNGDGRQDILVMTAQAREAVQLFVNMGKNEFKMETLIEQPPTWGFAGFEIVDFNKDGKLDLLTANGDNGDYALPVKSYHGVRLYLNDGRNRFREAHFYPMDGAYKAMARDFDGDGDLDIAAIAFYPDFSTTAPENFVYLEQTAPLRFTGATFPESNAGRWMVMDAGDADGDGDADVVLGSFVRGPTTVPVPFTTRESWRTNGAVLVLLENKMR